MNKEEIKCLHCGESLKMWQTPTFNFAGGSGFGYSYLYVCFNDLCPFYVKGWLHTEKKFGRKASYRFAMYPDSECNIAIPVFTKDAGKGNIINNPAEFYKYERIAEEKLKLYQLKITRNIDDLMNFISDENIASIIRIEAAKYLGEITDIDDIEKLYACNAKQHDVNNAVTDAIQIIHNRHFTRDCPFCAEIIKQRAKVCRYCKMEITD